MSITKQEAQAIDALCREHFDAFAEIVFKIVEPGTKYEWNWHIGCIAEHLEAMYRGEIPRLIINLPPRSLKSYLVSAAYPAWILGKKPTTKFINTSYGSTVVEQNSRNCRMIMRDTFYQNIFQGTRINPEMDRLTHFETTQRGQYYAATALSPITGIGCEYMILDDPIKPMEAFSETIRASTNQNIRTTLMNRYNDKRVGKFLMIMQRAHEDDPTGNLLKDGGYVHVKLPAEARSQVVISLAGREKPWIMEKGDLLFPARLDRAELDRTRLDMTELNYAGQFLQEPVPIGGGEFKEEWWLDNYYDAPDIKPREMNVCILVDPSAGEEANKKKKKTSDFTAMMVVGLAPDWNYYLLDIIRDRLNPTERVDTLFLLHRKWSELTGKPPKVGYEKYGMTADTHYIRDKMKVDGYRFALIELGGQMVKENRIRRLIPDMQQRRWYFPQNLMYTDNEGRTFDLVRELLYSEAPSFPKARYDDMLDALARIYEEEMKMQFPALKSGARQSIQSMAGIKDEPQGWLEA